MTADFTKEEFEKAWPGGYIEDFKAYPIGAEEQVVKVLRKFANNKSCLEIGCGGGYWTTKYLLPMFSEVTCVDVIDRPKGKPAAARYIQVPSQCYTLPGIAEVDFVFSFGVFCHLTIDACEEYLKAIHRVLRPGHYAMVMFANWPRHPNLKGQADSVYSRRRHTQEVCWFYNDLYITRTLANLANLTFEDAIPDFRDTIAILGKL